MIVTFSKVDYASVCLQLSVPGNDCKFRNACLPNNASSK